MKLLTLIYKNGGEGYLGEHKNRNLKYYKKMGKDLGQKHMYKGYRYYYGERDIVVVFDNKKWDMEEKAKKKSHGFLNIREYII